MIDPKRRKYNVHLFTELLRKYTDGESQSRLANLRVSNKVINPAETLEDYRE